MELALIADGVPFEEVYDVLNTRDGVARAFAKLESIKHQIVWWQSGSQAPRMLADDEVVMTTGFNGRIFDAQVVENQPIAPLWDGQVVDVAPLAIVAGTPRLEEAKQYLAFATSAETQVRIGSRMAYSPARYSGRPLVTTHVETGAAMEPHQPVSASNSARTLRYDPDFWAENQDELVQQFFAWLAR